MKRMMSLLCVVALVAAGSVQANLLVNGDFEQGVSGFLASTEQEWVTAIQHLAEDEKLRISMGEAGRRHCLDHFTLQVTFQKMLATLENGPQRP